MKEYSDHMIHMASTIMQDSNPTAIAANNATRDQFLRGDAALGQVLDYGQRAFADTQSCTAFVSSALQLSAGGFNLFDDKLWEGQSEPPEEFLPKDAPTTEKDALTKEW